MKLAPYWIVLMDAAAEWGVPPWEIYGGSKVLWYARYEVMREARIAARKREDGK